MNFFLQSIVLYFESQEDQFPESLQVDILDELGHFIFTVDFTVLLLEEYEEEVHPFCQDLALYRRNIVEYPNACIKSHSNQLANFDLFFLPCLETLEIT